MIPTAWDVSRGGCFHGAFHSAKAFQGLGLQRWDVHSATTMSEMFYDAAHVNADLSQWQVRRKREESGKENCRKVGE